MMSRLAQLRGRLKTLSTWFGELAAGVVSLRTRSEWQRQQEHIAHLTRILKMQSAITSAVLRILDRDALLTEACRVATEVGRYERALVSMVAPGARRAQVRFESGMPASLPRVTGFDIGDGTHPDRSLTGRALRTGEVAVCRDLAQFDLPILERERLLTSGVRSMAALPLVVEGVSVGALTLLSHDTTHMRDDELLLLKEIAATLSFALRFQQQADIAQYLSHHDSLTGLAKRSVFSRRLDDRLRQRFGPEDNPAVAALDLHHLNHINDSFGPHFGDALLQEVAERLKEHAGSDDRVGYLGGGTFVLVEPGVKASHESITSLIDASVFGRPFIIDGRRVRVSCCSGVARYPVDGEDGSTLVQKAEAALKQAKATGERYLHYKLEMRSEVAERLALEHKLREAIDKQQFELYYQPQVCLASGRIESLEALLRWHDPEEGLVLPARFLPILEASGLIIQVGQWVLERAVKDCQHWQQLGLGPIRVAVNVSAIQIRRRLFVDHVLELLSGWPGHSKGYGVDLELTETALLQDIEVTGGRLRELRAAGIRIALDDFGTGYSSLGLLSKLPVDLLKIDRSFVRDLPNDPTNLALTRSIIDLASAFGLLTVAEGVESAEQVKALRILRCDQSQGDFHCPPRPAAEMGRLLQSSKTSSPVGS